MLAAAALAAGLSYAAVANGDAAGTVSSTEPGHARACLAAAGEAEARLGLPTGLLAAVTMTESAAHPFAIGTPARSVYAETRDEAVRIARQSPAGASGGCFQINIGVHARRNPAWVFDPWRSALFAGQLLARHSAERGEDWGHAVARYAGARPGTAAARQHRCRIAASLAGLGHPQPRGLSTEGCRPGEARVARE
ncbi:transglycosylase SLT domain-containing protein, partial [Elioraea rosea]|uniref:transglycosylase SLT domain-containing protein n=1 Tax=Elioraea rosea TaxID=2492390 RepID=UPI0013152EA9